MSPSDLGPGGGGVPVSPSEGSASGGELPGAVGGAGVCPAGLSGVAVLCGGKPVRGEAAPRPAGLREGLCAKLG